LKLLRIAVLAIGVCLFAGTLLLTFVSNINTGLLLTLGIGIFLIGYGYWFDAVNRYLSRGFGRLVKWLLFIVVLVGVGVSVFIYVYGTVDNVTYKEDALIVLGGGVRGERILLPLQLRLDAAIAYLGKNPDAVIVVSGGKGFGEAVSEAYAMKQYLVQHDIPEGQILEEDQSTSTSENFKFSKKMLNGKLAADYSVCYITNDFHIFRSMQLAQLAGLEPTHLHAQTPWYTIPNNYVREILALMKFVVLRY
jgi:uncharacterized SAM-binding protein YcdF (DUF218 family)